MVASLRKFGRVRKRLGVGRHYGYAVCVVREVCREGGVNEGSGREELNRYCNSTIDVPRDAQEAYLSLLAVTVGRANGR